MASVNDLVDGMERTMPFDDLPDIAIMQVMDKLDLQSRLRMRLVSKRMNGLQLQVKNNMKEIYLFLDDIKPDGDYAGLVPYSSNNYRFRVYVDGLKNGLPHPLAYTQIQKIHITIFNTEMTDFSLVTKVIEDLENFDSEELEIYAYNADAEMPQIDLSILLSLARKFREVWMKVICSSLTVQDLILIRKKIIEGECRLESFLIKAKKEERNAFMKECFGITIEETNDYMIGEYRKTFRSQNESVELYADYGIYGYEPHSDLCHIDGDIKTTFDHQYIIFEKCKGGAKPNKHFVKVKMNHLYLLD